MGGERRVGRGLERPDGDEMWSRALSSDARTERCQAEQRRRPKSSLTLTTLPPIAPHHDPSTMAPRSNITGFDPKKFAAASANGTKGDPWAR